MKSFDRLKLLIDKNILNDIQNKTILIVGIGGVGGYALESIVRMGIRNIVIIDSDKIDETNINRQIIALETNVGLNKVLVASNRVHTINSEAHIEPLEMFLDKNNICILDKYKIDYIVDACDTISTKIELIRYAINNNIKIVSCMGVGKRLDATKLCISKLDKTVNDPLAKIIRNKLKKENITLKIPVVFSSELPINSNNQVIGSCSYVPAVAGLYLTNFIVNDIIKSYCN